VSVDVVSRAITGSRGAPNGIGGHRRAPDVSDQAEPPTITVTIGRIEVRAAPTAPLPAPTTVAPRQDSRLSLDEYLARRSEGRR
jgi:hypothetical protein